MSPGTRRQRIVRLRVTSLRLYLRHRFSEFDDSFIASSAQSFAERHDVVGSGACLCAVMPGIKLGPWIVGFYPDISKFTMQVIAVLPQVAWFLRSTT